MKYRSTVYLKFLIAYLVFGFLCIATIETVTSDAIERYLVRHTATQLYKEATLLSNYYSKNLTNRSKTGSEIRQQISDTASTTSTTIWVLATNGTLLFDTSNPYQLSTTVIDSFEEIDLNSDFYMVDTFNDYFPQKMLSVVSPVNSNFHRRAYIFVHIPYSEISEMQYHYLQITYTTLGIIFALSLIFLLIFTTVVYFPMRKITRAAREYTNGNLSHVIDVEKNDEIGRLAASLNLMASELSRAEENQKKFIANVSHDFRSPLTSIRGYLEAMVDGTIPPELHEKYLKIVLNETDRLTKLTNSLLTLNNLNTKGMVLEVSDFDINKVIKNTAATFEGSCKKKQIRFKLVLTGHSLYVHADEEKIKQVLYNLIDNAIKFSNPDSTIKVETTEKNETVFVSVKDSGIGIPKDSLKLIFDRFYKTDLSRGKDKKGTGLGLSITKEIINAHHENINVISTEGVGTEFIFTLSKSKQQPDDYD